MALDLAYFGAAPAFVQGQIADSPASLPPWDDVEAGIRGIFSRRYFANNGPLVRDLDATFSVVAGRKHAVSVTNAMMASLVLAAALEIRGEVVLSALAPQYVAEGLRWAGCAIALRDVEEETLCPTLGEPEAGADDSGAVWIAPVLDQARAPSDAEAYCQKNGLPLVVDAGDALVAPVTAAGSRATAEIFGFGSANFIDAGEGGIITTDDEALAAKLRTIRNFHAAQTFAPVAIRTNAKMSEVQAALILAGMMPLHATLEHRRSRATRYAAGFAGIDGLRMRGGESNGGMRILAVVDAHGFGLSAHELVALLRAEAIPASLPLRALAAGFPVAERLAASIVEFPSGDGLRLEHVDAICRCVRHIRNEVSSIVPALRNA